MPAFIPATLQALGNLAVTSGNIIVGDGTTWVAESGSTARGLLGLAIGTDVQAYDATLAALAAYNTNGIIVQTAADSFAGRTIVAGVGVTVTNGSGVSGNPSIAIGQEVATNSSPTFAAVNTAYASNGTTVKFATGQTGVLDIELRTGGLVYRNLVGVGGWARGFFTYLNSSNATYFMFGAYGNGQTVDYGFIGPAYNDTWQRWYPSGVVSITKNLCIGHSGVGTSLDKGIAIDNGTAPSTYPRVQIWAEGGEGKIADTSGNVTVLSPHAVDRGVEAGIIVNPDDHCPQVHHEYNVYTGWEMFRYHDPVTGKTQVVQRELPVEMKRDWYADQQSMKADSDAEIATWQREKNSHDEVSAELVREATSQGKELSPEDIESLRFERARPDVYEVKDPPLWMQQRGVTRKSNPSEHNKVM